MKIFEGTDLPDDLLARVEQYLDTQRRDSPSAPADAALAIMGRPLTHQEKMAIVDALQAGKGHQSLRGFSSEATSAVGPK